MCKHSMNGLPESIQALCTFQHSPLPAKVFLMEGGISVQRLFCKTVYRAIVLLCQFDHLEHTICALVHVHNLVQATFKIISVKLKPEC